jgi:curved DNA-binding protein CbpA
MSSLPERDLYKVLQVDPGADPDVIAAAYQVLSAKLDPGKKKIGQAEEMRLAELYGAFATLHNPVARRAYDEERRPEIVAVGPGHDGAFRRIGGGLTERVEAGPTRAAASAPPGPVRASLNGATGDLLTIQFGRYAGWSLGALVHEDPDYLRWLSRHSSGIRYRGAILRLLAEQEAPRVPQRTRW